MRLRESRNREELRTYREQYMAMGIADDNILPIISASWQQSRELGADFLATKQSELNVLFQSIDNAPHALVEQNIFHSNVIKYIDDLLLEQDELLEKYRQGIILTDDVFSILYVKNLQDYPKLNELRLGTKLDMNHVGTSSLSLAAELGDDFLLYGQEAWNEIWHDSDAYSCVVSCNGAFKYILTMVMTQHLVVPRELLMAQLNQAANSISKYLTLYNQLNLYQKLTETAGLSVFSLERDGHINYANSITNSRIAAKQKLDFAVNIKGSEKVSDNITDAACIVGNIKEVIENYEHTPMHEVFAGKNCTNQHVSWSTKTKIYEEITTAVPLELDENGTVKLAGIMTQSMSMVQELASITATKLDKQVDITSMVGESRAFARLKTETKRLIKRQNDFIIYGEPGTGKKRLAFGIYKASSRANGPFVTVSCGEMMSAKLAEELFGYRENERISHAGKLEQASGGVLFMDELDRLPLELGRILKEFLLGKYVVRQGETEHRPLDLRFIAACDTNLKLLSRQGCFDKDLLEYLWPMSVKMPLLQDRSEDIPILAKHITNELIAQNNLTAKTIHPDTMKKLQGYSWPGNIKELKQVLSYAVFKNITGIIMPEEIVMNIPEFVNSDWKNDKNAFRRMWCMADGNISRLAVLLNTSRVTLYRYMKKYDLY